MNGLEIRFCGLCFMGFSSCTDCERPVTCWTPAQFTAAHTNYANAVCEYEEHRFLPLSDPLPMPGNYSRPSKICRNFGEVVFLVAWGVCSPLRGSLAMAFIEVEHRQQSGQLIPQTERRRLRSPGHWR